VPARKKQILILDPDAFLAGIYARRFESGRWGVRVAETAAEARKLIAKKAPDAVLVDTGTLPDALAFIRALEQDPATASITVVALTALGDRQSVKAAMDAGAEGYLIKGHFVPTEVREKVERLVADARA